MHDLGKMVLASQLEDEYRAVVAHAVDRGGPPSGRRSASSSASPTTRSDTGWCLRWKLPASLAEPIARHHEPDQGRASFTDAAAIVHVADLMIRGYGFGFAGDRVMPALDDAAWRHLGLNADKLRTAVRRLQQDLHEALRNVHLITGA
jgi:HD-like signal output (HDOD) protein